MIDILEKAIKRLNTTITSMYGIKELEEVRGHLCQSRDILEAKKRKLEKEIIKKNIEKNQTKLL